MTAFRFVVVWERNLLFEYMQQQTSITIPICNCSMLPLLDRISWTRRGGGTPRTVKLAPFMLTSTWSLSYPDPSRVQDLSLEQSRKVATHLMS